MNESNNDKDVSSMRKEYNLDGTEDGDSVKIDQAVGERLNEDEYGHIAVSRGVRIGGEDETVSVYVRTEKRDEIQIGDYVEVPIGSEGEEFHLFASVRSMNYDTESISVNDLDDLGNAGSSGIDMERYPMIAELQPITILRPNEHEENGLERKAVSKVPHPFAPVSPVTTQNHIYRGLNLPSSGIPLGHVSVGGQPVKTGKEKSPVVYNLLDPQPDESRDPAIFRHMLVAGATGKGKTQMSKNIIRQFAGGHEGPEYLIEDSNHNEHKEELNVVILDPENEYTGLAKDPELDNVSEEKLFQYESEGFRVGAADDVVAFVPDVAGSEELVTDAKKTYNFSIPFEIVRERPQILMHFEAGEATKDALRTVLDDYFTEAVNNPKNAKYEDFLNFIESNVNRYTGPNGTIHESSWTAMKRRVDTNFYTHVFDQGAEPITSIEPKMFKSGRVSIVPTDHIIGNAERLVVMSILSYIVENKLKTHNPQKDIKNTPILLCVDEAHNYLSSRENTQEAYIIRKFVQAAKQGRKESLGLYTVTQNPLDIDEEIRQQMNTKMYLGLEPATIEKVNIPGDFKSRLSVFSRGQAVIKAPDVHPIEVQGLDIPVVKHE